MKIRKIYQYALSLITLVMMIGGGIGIFSHAAQLASPPAPYQTFDDYKNEQEYLMAEKPEKGQEVKPKTEEEMKKAYEEMTERVKEEELRYARLGMIQSLGWILVPLPFFLMTRREMKAELEKEEKEDN